jgi:type I restriction enzyme M protein
LPRVGFLIAAYEHILLANTNPDLIRETIGPDGLPVRRGIGDKLKRAQWDFLQKGAIHGFESDPDILRLAAMNAVLHQFDQSAHQAPDRAGREGFRAGAEDAQVRA